MEKRVLYAALLSALILLVWYSVFTPSGTPSQPTRPAASPAVPPPTTVATSAPDRGPAATATPAAPVVGAPAPARGEGAVDLPLSAPGWAASVNSAGGVIASLTLAEYKDEDGRPLQLVGGAGGGILRMETDGPWNQDPYVVEKAADGVHLRWSDGAGNWVEKRIAAGKGRYGLDVEVRAGGGPARGGVVVGLGRVPKSSEASRLASVGGVVQVNGKLERIGAPKPGESKEIRGGIGFAGVEEHYFLVVLLPEGGIENVRVTPRQVDGTAVAEVVALGTGGVVRGALFAGPKDRAVLLGYGRGLEDTMSFGIFGVFSVMFLAALRWIYTWTGNWGLAIAVLTAGIRVVLFPLMHKSTVAMKRMQTLQPKVKAIQERYHDRAKKDPQVRARMNQEVMQLYKVEGVNPMGGCLPTLIQLPILWALYTLFANAIELRHAPFVFWIHDLSAKDPTYVTPILMTASMFLQQWMAPQAGDPAQRRMFMMMPLIFGFMFMSFPSGLVWYWLVNNLLTIGQQLITEKLMKGAGAKA